jgi:hypothetical protein
MIIPITNLGLNQVSYPIYDQTIFFKTIRPESKIIMR